MSRTCSCSGGVELAKYFFGETSLLCCPRCGVCEVPFDERRLAELLSRGFMSRSLQEGSDVQAISRVFQIPVGVVLLHMSQIETIPQKRAIFVKKSIERLCQSLVVQANQVTEGDKSEIAQHSTDYLGYSLIDIETRTLVVAQLVEKNSKPADIIWQHTPNIMKEHGLTIDRLKSLIADTEL